MFKVTFCVVALLAPAFAQPGPSYNCDLILDCIAITEEDAPAGTCGNSCAKKVCLELTTGTDCPDNLSHVCDQADASGCPYDSQWDSSSNSVNPPCLEFDDVKCEGGSGPPVGTKMCQYAAPGEKIFWILKKQNVMAENPVTVSGDAKCYLYEDWSKAGYGNTSPYTGTNTGSCSGNSQTERVVEYEVQGTCSCPGTFCGCGTEVEMDFDMYAHGDWISALANDVRVRVRPKTGGVSTNEARVYDTSRVAGAIDSEEEDPDLDCTSDGKALIIQEDNLSGLPDDNERGGFIDFFFPFPTDIGEVRILDNEKNAIINTWDVNRNKVKNRVSATNDCGKITTTINERDVKRMTVKLRESGAVSAFTYCEY